MLHVAWFEPVHHVVEAVAPFFARRFANLRWVLLTPERSVRWDGARLDFGPGARRDEAPAADAGERLWLTYYEHIFNPARLKLAAMRREMPRRYWRNLPEAVLISPLAAAAGERSARMVAQESVGPRRRIPSHVRSPAPGSRSEREPKPAVAASHRRRRVSVPGRPLLPEAPPRRQAFLAMRCLPSIRRHRRPSARRCWLPAARPSRAAATARCTATRRRRYGVRARSVRR